MLKSDRRLIVHDIFLCLYFLFPVCSLLLPSHKDKKTLILSITSCRNLIQNNKSVTSGRCNSLLNNWILFKYNSVHACNMSTFILMHVNFAWKSMHLWAWAMYWYFVFLWYETTYHLKFLILLCCDNKYCLFLVLKTPL